MSASLRKRLAELDAQIVEQKRALAELQQTRSDVERELNATATFPVLTLPVEITAEIFMCLTDNYPSCIGRHWYVNDANESPRPLVLAGVCRHWRDIALGTPVLWSKLEVQFDGITPQLISESGLVEGFVDQWLARAGSRPLFLDFESRDDTFALSRLRDLIHRWSYRVQYLQVQIGHRDIRPLGLDSAAFPLLQGAALGCNDQDPGIVFGTAPSFHDLHLLADGLTLSNFTLPWLQLTNFQGELWDMELFTLAPNLTDIICSFRLDHDGTLPIITHPNLISLSTNHGADVLEYLTLPALRHLDISDDIKFDPPEGVPYPLESFLLRSSPPLVSLALSFSGNIWETYRLDQCMRLVGGALESLEFWHVSGHLTFPFISDNLRPDILPNLRTLGFKEIYGSLNLPVVINLLYRFNKLRAATFVLTSSLFFDETLTVHTSTIPRCKDTISGHLSLLAQKGLDIYLGTDEKSYLPFDQPSSYFWSNHPMLLSSVSSSGVPS